MEIHEHGRNLRGSRKGGFLGRGAQGGRLQGESGWIVEEREKHRWERKPKAREVPRKTDNESSGGHFIYGFGCLTCCTAIAPSARKVRDMSSRYGSHHGKGLSLTKSFSYQDSYAFTVLLC